MPIRGFLSGQAFEPEVVRQMSLALETVCGKFGMKLTEDPATRVVALKIIELAQRVRDAPTLLLSCILPRVRSTRIPVIAQRIQLLSPTGLTPSSVPAR